MKENLNIGEAIKKYRIKSKMTQNQLGKLLGVSQVMISQYEKDIRHPKIETLLKIAEALSIKLSDLLEIGQIYVDRTEDGVVESLAKKEDGTTCRSIDLSSYVTQEAYMEHHVFEKELNNYFGSLNSIGQSEAIKRVEELTHIKKYTEKS